MTQESKKKNTKKQKRMETHPKEDRKKSGRSAKKAVGAAWAKVTKVLGRAGTNKIKDKSPMKKASH